MVEFFLATRFCDVRQGKKQSCCKTVVLFNDLWRENKTQQKIHSAYKIQPYLKLFKNVGKKTQHVFGGPGRKVFLDVFIIFRLRRPIPLVPYNEKI